MPSFDYRRETHIMTLSQFREYYQEEGYPQAFIVEQNQCMTGECRLQEGQIAIACHERTVRVLQATVLLKDGRTRPASIPINLKVLFALLPAENSMKFSGHPKLSAKDILQAKDGLPKAVQVLGPCKNSKKQPVPPNEVLFNVTKSGKHDFTGTSAAGVRHTFREGDSTAQFSSRLGDVKVYPVKFFDHITFPQKARVYLSEGQDCQVEGLEHMCIVEFTGRHEQQFLAIMPNIDDPENRDCQAVPSDLDIMVSAVTLKGYPMENLTLKDRKMIKQRSTDNVIQPPGNLYVAKPVDPTVRDEPDPAPLCDPAPPDSRRQSQISLGRSQSTFSVNMEIHYYNWPPEGPEGAVSPQTSGRRSIGLRLFPALSQSEQCLPTCVEDPSEYTYVQLDLSTPVQPRGPPSSSPPPPPLQHAKPQHRMSLPLQPLQVSRRPQQPNTIDEDDSHSSPPPPPPQHAKPKHRRSLPPQSSPVLPHPQQPDTIDEDAYEEMEVPVNWKLSQPQPSRPSPPVSPACSDARDEPDPAPLCDPAPPDSRRQSQISLGRSQSTFSVNMGSVLHHTREGLVFPKEPDIDIKASEAALDDLCWIPLGVQIQSAGPEGRRLPLAGPMEGGGRAIHLEVPPGAVGPSVTLEVHSAVIPNGSFTLPEGYQFGSHVVYIYFDGHHVTSPLHLHLPHWYGGQDQVQDGLSFAMAPHTLKEGESVYCFKLLEGGRFLNHCGELEIDGHCSLFAEVFKKGATSRYQAITLQKEEGNETTCDVAVMYATPLWCEILMKYRTVKSGWTVSNPTCPFTLKEGRIRGVLKEEHGNGWHAAISGSHELEPRHLEYDYHGITSPKLLEKAVNNRGYPPAITCVVTYREELRKIGNPVWVVLDLLGAENKLSFMCKAYEQTGRNAPHHSLDQKPTMRSLDEKLVVHVAGRWDSTGLHLNIEDHVLQAIRTPNGSSDEHCREMLRRWLNGEQGCGNLPRTWSSVLDAVEIGCGSEVCQRIKELL